MRELKESQHVENELFTDFKEDALRVRSSGVAIKRCAFVDTATFTSKLANLAQIIFADRLKLAKRAHRDAIQLIPPDECNGLFNQHYALTTLQHILIEHCWFVSPWSHAQGIFSSDGLIDWLIINNCNIRTKSQHKFTVNGLINGSFTNNSFMPDLYPARIGGGEKGCPRIWVHSFLEDDYQEIIGDANDMRRTYLPDGDIALVNFDRLRYRDYVMQNVPNSDAVTMCREFRRIALMFGDAG